MIEVNSIYIKKNDIIYYDYDNQENTVDPLEISKYLGCDVNIEKGVTFERIFNIIIQNSDIFNNVFYGATNGIFIEEFIEDFISDVQDENDFFSKVKSLEVERVYQHYRFDNGDEDEEYYYSFHGIGDIDDETGYSVGMSSLSNYKHIPINLNTKMEIRVDNGKEFKNINEYGDKYELKHTLNIPISLFNFIYAILYEITFNGAPENRDERHDQLMEQVNDIKEKKLKGEEVGHEMHIDENGELYLIKDGKRDYFLGKGNK